MNFTNYVEKKKKEARLINIKEIQSNVKAPWVQEKIQNHVKAFSGIITQEEVEKAIQESIIVASKFCKDPSKQNISENLAIEVLGVEKLAAAGKNCIRFNNNGDIVTSSTGNTKSADFIYQGYYATQKYTNDFGGAQDNQRNDVIDFLTRGSIKHKVIAIVDGDYWDKYRPELIQLFANNKNVIITSITEITEKEDEKDTF